ncbi:hypothetical protein PPACK8108_LOCUS25048 [Phakopsora pachyrhizi]|uniref:Uncharacterized protein n=1 Tax=Phakopsora pachyrhizi TaxID=170000 RepID=A0AAV0BUF0_PHAPC|nr:hypothetical protein PPACK8108_LOCUS25048 [Phakopsora pachyrhizi]
MSVATVVGPDVTKDRLRFKVSSKLGNSYPRFYLKGAHPLESKPIAGGSGICGSYNTDQPGVCLWSGASGKAGCSFGETEPGRGCTTAWVTTKTFNDLAPNDEESGIQQLSDVVWGFMNTPTSRLLSASGMSNNKRERLGFVNRHLRNTRTFLSSSGGSGSATDCNNSLASANTVTTTKGFNHDPDSPHRSILATSFTYDKSFGQEGQTLVGGQELELLGQGLKTHIEMTKSLVESLSFSYSSSQLSRITAGSNPKLSPSEFSHNSSPSGNNSTTSS